MVDILPFNGLFYNQERITDISNTISPPYDVISPELKDKLKKSNTYNIVNLILPDEENNKDKYTIAKDTLENWLKNDILKQDREECFYILEEGFIDENKQKSILGLVGLTKIEPYNKGTILRHEKTLLKPKQDRLSLLKNCRTNFGLIYTLYNDASKDIYNILEKELRRKPFVNIIAGYNSSLKFKLWKINNKKTIDNIIKLMKEKTLLIADGHHRYETSRIFKEEVHGKDKSKDCIPEDYILTLYISSNQKNISIHPTHRIIKFKNHPGLKKILEKINDSFYIESLNTPSCNLIKKKMLNSKLKNKKSFCFYFNKKDVYFLTLKSNIKDLYPETINLDLEYENLDVNILHKLLLDKLLAEYDIKNIQFIHSIEKVFKIINSKQFDIGIILNAPDVGDLKNLSTKGKIMPQKSTYFYPKPCTGLVMYKFDN
jgi:uncharacterized protein (DUF1015 family)